MNKERIDKKRQKRKKLGVMRIKREDDKKEMNETDEKMEKKTKANICFNPPTFTYKICSACCNCI